jgi:hypothetical protein
LNALDQLIAAHKAKSPVEAYEKAWAYLAIFADKAEFARHLDQVKFVSYDKGAFTFEAETPFIAQLFSRHAENIRIQRELESLVPGDVAVTVKVVPKAVQHG